MAKTLTQPEVDALLDGLERGELTTGDAGAPEAEAHPYDFHGNDASLKGRFPALEPLLERAGRNLRSLLAAEVGRAVEATFAGVEALSYEQFVKRLPLPCSIHLVALEPLPGCALFVMDAGLAYALIDLIFGGSGERIPSVEGREFTPLETIFLGRLASKMLQGVQEAWAPSMEVKGKYLRSEVNAWLLESVLFGETMAAASYRVELGKAGGLLLFALPVSALERAREQLKSQGPKSAPGTESDPRVREHLMGVEVSLRGVLDTLELSLEELLALRQGDVLQLDPQAMERVELWVEGRPRFTGRAAEQAGVRVVAVVERLEPSRP
jgi:flagellar motor switch protein FliM